MVKLFGKKTIHSINNLLLLSQIQVEKTKEEVYNKYSKIKGDTIMETMKDFERELEASFRKIHVGDIIKGTVIAVNEEEVILDLRQ